MTVGRTRLRTTARSVTLAAGLAMVSAFLFAACGGDDDGDDQRDPTSAASPSNGQQATQPSGASTPSGSSTPAGGGGDDAAAALRRAGQGLRDKSYRATYDFKGNDPEAGETDAVLIIGAKPPKYFFNLSGTTDGEPGTIIAISDGEADYLCFDQDGEQGCLKTSGSGFAIPSVFTVDDFLDELTQDTDVQVSRAGNETIAGQRGTCYNVVGSDVDGKICVSDQDGLVLLLEGTFEGAQTEMRMTNLGGAPPDSDFEPPWEVVEF